MTRQRAMHRAQPAGRRRVAHPGAMGTVVLAAAPVPCGETVTAAQPSTAPKVHCSSGMTGNECQDQSCCPSILVPGGVNPLALLMPDHAQRSESPGAGPRRVPNAATRCEACQPTSPPRVTAS